MATIDDIGTAGSPLSTPPLTAWQAAVRDAVKANQTAIAPILGALTPNAGWVDFGGAYAGMQCTKQGRAVTITGMLKPTADTAVTAGTNFVVASVPAGMAPSSSILGAAVLRTSGSAIAAAQVTITAAGQVNIAPVASATITAASGYVTFTTSYRSAS